MKGFVIMKLFDENVWSKVLQDNKDILEDYQLELESNGKSPKTIYQYMTDLRGFACWIEEHRMNNSFLNLKRRDFRKFFLDMANEGASNARINRMQSSIRNMLEYCVLDDDEYGDYEVNPMAHIKGLQKDSVREIVFLTDHEVNIILNYLMQHKQYEKALCISLTYDTAARRNEIYQVKKTGFTTSKVTNEVTGKRGKKFQLAYSSRTRAIAKIYLDDRGEDDCESLWAKKAGDTVVQVSYQTLYSWATDCRKIIKLAEGKDLPINFHSFRHSAGENFSDGTHHMLGETKQDKLDLNTIKAVFHHSDIGTSENYLKDHDTEHLENIFGVKFG